LKRIEELDELTHWAEPWKTKVVEHIPCSTREERERWIVEASYNPFNLRAEQVSIDLLTDSGTAAMSDHQWSALMLGDEAYAGSRSWFRFRKAVQDVLGFEWILPAHQGRAAENVLFRTLLTPGDTVIANMHFDTTRAHVQNVQAEPLDLIKRENLKEDFDAPFKGEMDIAALENALRDENRRVPLVILTITCNNNGGQPVSLQNIRQVSELARQHGALVFLDAARFAENAFLIKERESGYSAHSVGDIVRETMSCVDGCWMSAKKDALVNMGGFVAFHDKETYHRASSLDVLYEGFLTYGGLSGRDMEAIGAGLYEAIDERYLRARIGQIRYLWTKLQENGIPLVSPPGGHAVFVDGAAFFTQLDHGSFPAWALAVELYLEAGIRAVEIGTVMAGRNPKTSENNVAAQELLRLAIPRRVYSNQHMDIVAEALRRIYIRRNEVPGYAFTHEPPILRHFTASFTPKA
jgi:tryptophanase